LRHVGIFGPDTWPIWLGQPNLAMASIIGVHVWRTMPLATIISLGGLSSIPQDIHDAADVDGAGFFRHLFVITLPLILPILLVAVLFGLVFSVTDMIVVYVLTRGGPFDSTQVLASLAFFKSIDGGDLSGRSAVALFLLPVLAGVRGAAAPLCPAQRGGVMADPKKIAGGVVNFGVIAAFTAFAAFPFAWMVDHHVQADQDLLDPTHNPFVYHAPPTLEHLRVLFQDTLFLHWVGNTLFVGVLVVLITLVLAVPRATAWPRLTGAAGEKLGIGIFLTYLVPPTILFIPLSRLVASLGLQDRPLGAGAGVPRASPFPSAPGS
jgi:ABC-type sugar transport system permease subunit